MEAERLEAAYQAQGYPAVFAALAVAAVIYWLWARADRRRASRLAELDRESPRPVPAEARPSGTYAKAATWVKTA